MRLFLTLFLLAPAVLSQRPRRSSDNGLFPPATPRNLVQTCEFRSGSPCGLFFNMASNRFSFSAVSEDKNSRDSSRGSMNSVHFVTTPKGADGTARFGSGYIEPSRPYGPEQTRALCMSFRYRLQGDAQLALIEQHQGSAENKFWPNQDSPRPRHSNGWIFHTSQVTSDVPTRIFFEATVNRARRGQMPSTVAITDIKLYNTTCVERDGDGFAPYLGQSRALVPYWIGQDGSGVVYYEIQEGFKPEHVDMIERFIYEARTRTCVQFRKRGPADQSKPYMNFIPLLPSPIIPGIPSEPRCSADLGMYSESKITLEDACFEEGYANIAHMIMHGLGIRHEHVRPDRDSYVQVNRFNIQPEKDRQFNIRTDYDQRLVNQVSYDLRSVMHFYKDQFSTNGRNTIQKLGDPWAELGNRNGPSDGDWDKLATIYCGGSTRYPNTRPPTTPRVTTTTEATPQQMEPCTFTTTLSRGRGRIRNPRINGQYRPYEWCGWLIQAQPGKLITARFTMIDIEESPGCAKDQVTLFDGDDEALSPIIAGLCGQQRPVENYTTTGQKLLVLLSTDASSEATGFELNYAQIDEYGGPDPNDPDNGPAQNADTSPADCNFDASTCAFATDGALQWKKKLLTTLPNDHTTGTQHGGYMSLNASEASDNEYGLLRSARVQRADQFRCLTFWYKMTSDWFGHLNLNYATNQGSLHQLWSSRDDDRDAVGEWQQVKIDLENSSPLEQFEFYRFIFNGTITYSYQGQGMALDDVMLTQDWCYFEVPVETPRTTRFVPRTTTPEPWNPWNPTTTQSAGPSGQSGFSCHFEEDYCDWRNATSRSDTDWVRFSGRSTSGSPFGVQMDHTLETASGKYLLVNSLANQKRTARLEASIGANSGYRCFEFFYMMYGKHMGRIRVLAQAAWPLDEEMVLFEANGNKPEKWIKGQASLEGFNEAYTLIVEGYTTGQSEGDIGIDDLVLRRSSCYDAPRSDERLMPPTTPYTTPDYPYLCDFEDNRGQTFCDMNLRMTNVNPRSSNQFVAKRASDRARNAPSTDHSRNNSQGVFAYFQADRQGESGQLQTEYLSNREVNCMTINYYMSGRPGEIKVTYTDDYNTDRQLYHINPSNRFTDQWTNPQISIPRTWGRFRITINVISGGYGSMIAIDDVELARSSKCSPMARNLGGGFDRGELSTGEDNRPSGGGRGFLSRGKRQANSEISKMSCRFGNNDFCQWTSNGNWRAVTTSADVDRAGPDDRFAHVTSGRLVVLANNARAFGPAAAQLTSNITGTLTSMQVSPSFDRASRSCFHFWYKISGWLRDLPMDTLNVYVEKANDPYNKRRMIASYSASLTPPTDSMEEWTEASISLFERDDFKITFEAVTGDSWIGVLSIDDLSLRSVLCPAAGL